MKIFKNITIILALGMFLTACRDRETIVYQPVQPKPMYASNPDPTSGVLSGIAIGTMIADGRGGQVRYDGHNGYYDQRYRGPSKIIVNKKVVNNVNTDNNAPSTPIPRSVAPVANPMVSNKIKNPGDELAAKEKALMQAEQAQKAKQVQLKATLRANQEQRASGSSTRSSGFNKMSKSGRK